MCMKFDMCKEICSNGFITKIPCNNELNALTRVAQRHKGTILTEKQAINQIGTYEDDLNVIDEARMRFMGSGEKDSGVVQFNPSWLPVKLNDMATLNMLTCPRYKSRRE